MTLTKVPSGSGEPLDKTTTPFFTRPWYTIRSPPSAILAAPSRQCYSNRVTPPALLLTPRARGFAALRRANHRVDGFSRQAMLVHPLAPIALRVNWAGVRWPFGWIGT